MSNEFEAVKITDQVYWVGAIDWGLRNFHGYETGRGTTYNAYLIMADEPILIDTVKAPLFEQMLGRIASVVDPAKIKYVISNHSEMDHSGSLPRMLDLAKPEKIVASKMGVKALREHFHWDREIHEAGNGEKLNLAGANLQFFETRMLHWPDSMFTFFADEGVLFSNDGFGMHLASSERFDDELDQQMMVWEAAKYYANIILPYSPLVLKLLDALPSLGIEIKLIAPDHGPIWRSKIPLILDLYRQWAQQNYYNKAVIAFDTMWHTTEKMAMAIGEGLSTAGVSVKLMPMQGSHRSDVVAELLDAGAFLVGAPTMNNQLFPSMADVLTYVKGLKPRNLVGAAFGSYGWSGESVKQIEEYLQQTGVDLVDSINIKYVVNDDGLRRCKELGASVAAKLEEKLR
ncbi:MAG: FprA family A-type flavoprotein [Candidatus Alcyoniella australis]|nr:FprA family A-type flavoprotein [Candidatus Alcyoniella australis]